MRKRRYLWISTGIIVVLGFCSAARAAREEGGGMTAALPKGNQATFHNSRATAIFTVLAPDLVRIRLVRGTTPGPDYSWAVIKTDWPAVHSQISGDQNLYSIRTSELEVRIQMSPFRIAFYDLAGRLISKDKDS